MLGNQKYNLNTHSQSKNATTYFVKEGETKHCWQKYKLHSNIAIWKAMLNYNSAHNNMIDDTSLP